MQSGSGLVFCPVVSGPDRAATAGRGEDAEKSEASARTMIFLTAPILLLTAGGPGEGHPGGRWHRWRATRPGLTGGADLISPAPAPRVLRPAPGAERLADVVAALGEDGSATLGPRLALMHVMPVIFLSFRPALKADQPLPAHRTPAPARHPLRPVPLRRAVPARHRPARRRPGPPARHPYHRRRRPAARLRRRLGRLRRRGQPPHPERRQSMSSPAASQQPAGPQARRAVIL